MGESITTGMLSSWEVKSGSIVAADEVVGAIETDKVRVGCLYI
jgi:pyruvate/2-oxoglutarate dehydrogenase complex dihydrolipoamide acyltransferase (E2) component